MKRLLLEMSYDGSYFSGFQRQTNDNLQTVQGILEDTLSHLLKERVSVHGAGRTDTGVHAKAQMAHIDVSCSISSERLQYALNRALPQALVIKKIEETHADFHARKWAIGKWYSYLIYNGKIPPAIGHQYFTYIPVTMNETLFRQAITKVEGCHQFEGFCGRGSSVKNFERTIFLSALHISSEQSWWQVHFIGDGFLRKMVRNMIGTAIDVALKRRPLSCVEDALLSHDRKKAGPTAAANGLVLENIFYDNESKDEAIKKISRLGTDEIQFPW